MSDEAQPFSERIQAMITEKDRLSRCIIELQEERDDLMDAVIELLDVLTDPLAVAEARRRVIDGLIRVSGWRGYVESAALHAASGIDTGSELAADKSEPSHHVPDAEVGRDELIGMALRGPTHPVQPAGGPPDAVRPEGVEREALEGEHVQDDTDGAARPAATPVTERGSR